MRKDETMSNPEKARRATELHVLIKLAFKQLDTMTEQRDLVRMSQRIDWLTREVLALAALAS
jgi:hypothetical protein